MAQLTWLGDQAVCAERRGFVRALLASAPQDDGGNAGEPGIGSELEQSSAASRMIESAVEENQIRQRRVPRGVTQTVQCFIGAQSGCLVSEPGPAEKLSNPSRVCSAFFDYEQLQYRATRTLGMRRALPCRGAPVLQRGR